MSVFAVERQRRFSTRWRAAERTRFFCCLIFGIRRENARFCGPHDGSSGRRALHGRELAPMDDKRGGDRRSDAERRSGTERRGGDAEPPAEGDRRSSKDRRTGKERRSGKDRRSGG
jgi:hypothetical protein